MKMAMATARKIQRQLLRRRMPAKRPPSD